MTQLLENPHLTAVAAAFTILAASLLIVRIFAGVLRRMAARHRAAFQVAGRPNPLESILGRHLEAVFIASQLPALPLMIFGAYAALILWKPAYRDMTGVLVLAVAGFGLMVIQVIFFLRVTRGFSLAGLTTRNRWLTGQALLPLIHQGYHLYHDVQVNSSVIDHLVVGTKGIFAIQVFTPQVVVNQTDTKETTATYDGRSLVYGGQTDFETINQAQLRTDQLSEWLSGFLSEPVAARAVVAMPGWTVRRTSSEGISVVNPRQFGALFAHISARPLEEADLQAIAERMAEGVQGNQAAEGFNPAPAPVREDDDASVEQRD